MVVCYLFGTLFRTIVVRTRTNKSGYLTCESLADRQYLEKAIIKWSRPDPPLQRLSLHLCVRSVRCHACTTRSVAAYIGVEVLPALASFLRCIYVCVWKFSSNPKCVQLAKSYLLCKIAKSKDGGLVCYERKIKIVVAVFWYLTQKKPFQQEMLLCVCWCC